MGYKVVAPCIVVKDGKSLHYRKSGKVIDVDDVQAAELVKAGKIVPEGAPPVEFVEPWTEPSADAPLTDPLKTLPGRVLAGMAGAQPALPDDEPVDDEPTKPRRRGRRNTEETGDGSA